MKQGDIGADPGLAIDDYAPSVSDGKAHADFRASRQIHSGAVGCDVVQQVKTGQQHPERTARDGSPLAQPHRCNYPKVPARQDLFCQEPEGKISMPVVSV